MYTLPVRATIAVHKCFVATCWFFFRNNNLKTTIVCIDSKMILSHLVGGNAAENLDAFKM